MAFSSIICPEGKKHTTVPQSRLPPSYLANAVQRYQKSIGLLDNDIIIIIIITMTTTTTTTIINTVTTIITAAITSTSA